LFVYLYERKGSLLSRFFFFFFKYIYAFLLRNLIIVIYYKVGCKLCHQIIQFMIRMKIGPCSLDMRILNNYWRFSINGDTLARVVTILWMIWCRRNQKCWNDVFPVVFEVGRRAIKPLEDWLWVRCKSKAGSISNIIGQIWYWLIWLTQRQTNSKSLYLGTAAKLLQFLRGGQI